MQSFEHFLAESTINVENVKQGIVHYINDALASVSTTGGNIAGTIKIGNHKIQNVAAARPANYPSTAGIIPYVDIDLILTNGATIKLGLRTGKNKFFVIRDKRLGKAAIPAFERGIHTVDKMFPALREMFVSSLLTYYTDKGFSHGVSVPTVYGKLPEKMKETALLGSKEFGGRADYIVAIDKAPFTWKKIRIPTMAHGFSGSEFIIEIMEARAFDSAEIMANNNLYIWAQDTEGRSLYLFSDKVDKNNLPAVLGPGLSHRQYYGIKNLKVAINIDSKMQFDIEDNMKTARLVLKSPVAPGTALAVINKPNEDDDDDDVYTRRRSRERNSQSQDRKDYGVNLSPDERMSLVRQIGENTVRGWRHRFREDLNKERLENVVNQLEDLDDVDLKRLASLEGHRLAMEIKRMFL